MILLVGLSLTLSVAIRLSAASGVVVSWGYNKSFGQATVPSGLTEVVAVAAGGDAPGVHSLALKADGTVVAWGGSMDGPSVVPAGLSNVTTIVAGGTHSLALRSDGTVVAWDEPDFPPRLSAQSQVPAGLTGVVAIAAGPDSSLAVNSDGTVVGWGQSLFLQQIPVGLTGVTSLAAGSIHAVALKNDGTIVTWSSHSVAVTHVPDSVTNVVAIAAGESHSLALRNDGTVVAWGDNSNGQTNVPPGLSNVVAIAAAGYHSMALRDDGTIVVWGDATGSYLTIPNGMSGAAAIATSRDHMVAVIAVPRLPGTDSSSRKEVAGSSIVLSGSISNAAPELSTPTGYRWRFNGMDIPGATNSTLTLSNVTRASSGLYTVAVSNSYGALLSAMTRLRVQVPQRLQLPEPLENGQFRLRFGASDGGALMTNDLPGFEVWATTNLSNTNAWMRITSGMSVTNGQAQVDDADSPGLPRRFYRVIER